MKLGVLLVLFSDKTLADAAEYVAEMGIQTVELGTGNYAGSPHFDVDALLSSARKRKEMLKLLKDNGLEISALSCHGNVLHPDPKFAKPCIEIHKKTVRLANALGVKVVIDFSGCPGDSDRAKYPNWVTCPWPPDYLEMLEWQWKKKVIPHWSKAAAFARKYGIKLAFEMHPGFVVYNTETMLKLRAECGNNIGANFDPSHLFWQGMDPVACVRKLGKAIYHVHAKDTRIYEANSCVNGVLDTKPYSDELNRSWLFRTVGYGHGVEWWKDFISTLRMAGYDGALSIEHEDSLMSNREGLAKAVATLKEAMLTEKPGVMYWA
jgi:sugar phosphate isomerase/epimerase